ncbi:MAG: hypothetical protein V4570_01875 [Pseudomonadota bacterium]
MSAFFSTLSCCWFWLLLGVLIGWLLNRWLCKCSTKPNPTQPTPATKPGYPPPAKSAEIVASTVVIPAAIATPAKASPKPAAKPKTAAKPAAKMTNTAIASSAINIDLAAAKAAGFRLKNADDLTIIEGIGPKINALFVDNDVKTFVQLAELTVPQMREILDKGGASFRIANPSTWAKQAKLASANKWAELKKLQDELSGGVKK